MPRRAPLGLRLVTYLACDENEPRQPTNAQLARALGVASPRSGSVYRALQQATSAGLVEVTYRIDRAGHTRRTLVLTDLGRQLARQHTAGGGA